MLITSYYTIRYLSNETYYRVSNLDGRLDTPDHCLTDDISAFAGLLMHSHTIYLTTLLNSPT